MGDLNLSVIWEKTVGFSSEFSFFVPKSRMLRGCCLFGSRCRRVRVGCGRRFVLWGFRRELLVWIESTLTLLNIMYIMRDGIEIYIKSNCGIIFVVLYKKNAFIVSIDNVQYIK